MQAPGTGQAPYGFRWHGRRLVSNGEEAMIRRTMFELFAEHGRKGTVARILNQRGLRTRRGGKWTDMAVSRLLACPSARGLYAINRTTTDASGKRIERPEEEWEAIQCDQIVSDELWDQVQGILEEQNTSRPTAGKKPLHTFSGLLRCACGGTMAVLSNSSKYVCGECRNKIPCEDLEDIFRDQLSRLILDRPDLFGDPPAVDENVAEAETRLADARETMRKTKRQMRNFEHLFASEEISLERFGEIHPPLEKRRNSLNEEIRRLESEIQRKKSASRSNDEGEEAVLDFRILVDQWHTVPLEDRRAIVQSLVDHITVGDGQVEFAYAFPNKSEDSSKDATVSQQMTSPTNGSALDSDEPVYIRLPKAGKRCPRTGLTRSALNNLILPTKQNRYNPPVASKSIRQKGKVRGIRMILWESLKTYLAEHERG